MTNPMIDLSDLIEKSMDGDWLREMISFAAERLMDLDVEGLCGAGFGEPSDDRTNLPKRLSRSALGGAPAPLI